jgi:hypothetical protein
LITAIMAGPHVSIESFGPMVRSDVDRLSCRLQDDVPKVRSLAMKLQMTRGTWLLILALTGCLPASLGFAQSPHQRMTNHLERAGRLYGVCWGDGYHACSSSGKRLLADLPPTSALTTTVSHRKSNGQARRRAATFYDRFDAINQSLFHTTECCVPGCEIVDCDGSRCHKRCDRAACDTSGCDGSCDGMGASYGTERGVSMTPGNRPMPMQVRDPSTVVELPSFSGPPQPEFAAPEQNKPDESEIESIPAPKPDTSVEPLEPAGEATQKPNDVRFDSQPTLSAPLVSENRQLQRPIRPQPAAVSPLTNAFRDSPDPVARLSATPGIIVPDFPTKAKSVSPKPLAMTLPTYARTDEQPARLGQTITSPVEVSPSGEQSAEVSPTTIAARPRRLGQTASDPTPSNVSITRPDRPIRLGASSATSGSKPFDARPVVEMAKRVSESDDGVIRQPSQLK